MELTPEEAVAKDRWHQGVEILNQINKARTRGGNDPIEVDLSQAPASVKAEMQAAEREEARRVEERTRELELENARLQGRIDERKAR